VANSFAIADTVFAVRERYNIDLDLLLTNPGATYSDHASFWTSGYGAVLMIEEFGADGNPFYHTPNDRVEHFDVPYYEKLAKLSIGSFATLAVPFNTTASVDAVTAGSAAQIYAYPNPTDADAMVWLDLPATARWSIALLNAMGQEVTAVQQGELAAGKHHFMLPLAQLAPGTYSVVARSTGRTPLTARVVRTP
jgi:hypothetical protein